MATLQELVGLSLVSNGPLDRSVEDAAANTTQVRVDNDDGTSATCIGSSLTEDQVTARYFS
jgi:hypothetical protein